MTSRSINNNTAIKIITADWKHKVMLYDNSPPPGRNAQFNDDVYCRLPMNQLIAIEEYLRVREEKRKEEEELETQQPQTTIQTPIPAINTTHWSENPTPNLSNERYLVSVSSSLIASNQTIPSSFFHIKTNPNLFSGLVFLLPITSNDNPSTISTLPQFVDLKMNLKQISIYTPIFLVFVLPIEPGESVPGQSDTVTLKMVIPDKVCECINHIHSFFDQCDDDDDDDNDDENKLNLIKRTIYHFVVPGLEGYYQLLPYIQQTAIAHFFSVALSNQDE